LGGRGLRRGTVLGDAAIGDPGDFIITAGEANPRRGMIWVVRKYFGLNELWFSGKLALGVNGLKQDLIF
jgi:hypothetical protein